MQTFKQYLEEQNKIDDLQLALDVAGFDPGLGTVADITNAVISSFRAAIARETDERKRHILNAGISAASILPAMDILKLIKYKKVAPSVKNTIKASTLGGEIIGKVAKTNTVYGAFSGNSAKKIPRINRFNEQKEEKRRLDPKCWKGYRRSGTKLKGDTRVNKCVKVKK